ncbi:MAG: hypothetical protein ACE5KH_02435 [Candidatus Geothermarchaeales archaeon]
MFEPIERTLRRTDPSQGFKQERFLKPTLLASHHPFLTCRRFEHVNVFEDHAVLRDNVLKRTVFVYRRNDEPSSDLCEGIDCARLLKSIPELGSPGLDAEGPR